MFMKKYNLIYMIILFLSPIFLFFLNTYYSMWIMMELNLLLFLTLVIMNMIFVSDISMKYYFLNSFSSMIFMFFINLSMIVSNFNFLMMLNLMMLMKLGSFPFHFWFIDMMMQLNWMMCFILSTWQKLIPMLILIYIYVKNLLMIVTLIMSLFSVMMIFNQIILKKLLAYSSMNHMSWMMFSLMINFNLWLMYYFSYMFINYVIMNMFWKLNFLEINDLLKFMKNLNYSFYLFMLMLSLGGVPPLYGFLMKWFFIMKMSNLKNFFFLLFLIFYSLIFLFYYLRLTLNFMMLYHSFMNFNLFMNYLYKEKNYNFFLYMNFFMTMNLLMYFMFF